MVTKGKVIHCLHSSMENNKFKVAVLTDLAMFKIYRISKNEKDKIVDVIKDVVGKEVDVKKLLFGHNVEVNAEVDEATEYKEYRLGVVKRVSSMGPRAISILGQKGAIVIREALNNIKRPKTKATGNIFIQQVKYQNDQMIKITIGDFSSIAVLTKDADIFLKEV